VIGSIYLMLLPLFADPILEAVLGMIDDIRLGSLVAALAIMFLPVVFLGMYSPFAIRLLLLSPLQSGSVSGAVYSISTFGSIIGTWGTTFALMPALGSRAITTRHLPSLVIDNLIRESSRPARPISASGNRRECT
jgi:hypothetical protein